MCECLSVISLFLMELLIARNVIKTTYGRDENCLNVFLSEEIKRRDHLKYILSD